jgi:hypothetical protein
MSCIEKLRILININVVFKQFNMNQLTKEIGGVAFPSHLNSQMIYVQMFCDDISDLFCCQFFSCLYVQFCILLSILLAKYHEGTWVQEVCFSNINNFF